MLLALLLPLASATTLDTTAETCPICGTEVEVHHIHSTGYTGVDRDFLKRYWGAEPEESSASTCARCGYTGFPTEWDSDDAPEGMEEAIAAGGLGEAGIPSKKQTPYSSVTVPEKMVLLAKTTELRGEESAARAWAWHRAAWSVRLRAGDPLLPLGEHDEDPLWQRILTETEIWSNTADREVLQGARLVLETAELPDAERACSLATRGLYYLVSHGEHVAAEQALSRVEACTTGAQRGQIYESMPAEQEHLKRALQHFQATEAPRADIVYIQGELSRRLGLADQALALLEEAKDSALWRESPWPAQQACVARGGSTVEALVQCMKAPEVAEEPATPQAPED